MKNAITITLIVLVSLMFSGCAEEKTIDGFTYQPYGLFDEDEIKAPGIVYKVDAANVVWAIILCETIFVPVIVVGWNLYEPVSKSDHIYIPH